MPREIVLTSPHVGSKADHITFVFPDNWENEKCKALISDVRDMLFHTPQLCYSINGKVEIMTNGRARIVTGDLQSCEVLATSSFIAETLVRMDRATVRELFGSLMSCPSPDGWEFKFRRFCCAHLENPEKRIAVYVTREVPSQFHVHIHDSVPPHERRAFLIIRNGFLDLLGVLMYAEEIAKAMAFHVGWVSRYRLINFGGEQILVDFRERDEIIRAIEALQAGR
jgi:hypothetical protein